MKHSRGRNFHGKRNNQGYDGNVDQSGYLATQNYGNQGMVNNFLQLTNITDIAAIGGFNPGKYLAGPPPPQPVYAFTAPQQVFE